MVKDEKKGGKMKIPKGWEEGKKKTQYEGTYINQTTGHTLRLGEGNKGWTIFGIALEDKDNVPNTTKEKAEKWMFNYMRKHPKG